MAVARMLKVTAISHASAAEELVDNLRKAGVLDIVEGAHDLPTPHSSAVEERIAQLDEQIAYAQFVVEFLGRYHTSDAPFSSFISEKFHLTEDEFYALDTDEAFFDLYGECEYLSDHLASMERQRERLRSLISELQPWAPLHLQISQWRGTEHVMLLTGTVPASEGEAIREHLRGAVSEVTVEELGAVGSRSAWVVMAHKEHVDDVRAALHLTNFTEVAFPELSDYPAEEISVAQEQLKDLANDTTRMLERAKELSDEHYEHCVGLAEALVSARDILLVRESFGATERTIVISGWVTADKRGRLEAVTESMRTVVDLTLEQPGPEDKPPIELDNPAWLRPFEVLTDLYGRPQYDEVDPTPLMAGFFFIFFGMALADVGYGLVLLIVAQLIKRKLDVGEGVKRFMDLLTYGGVASMLLGVVTGSYFAVDAKLVPDFLLTFKLFDPLEDIMLFLVISVALGVVHILLGLMTRAVVQIRQGDWRGAVAGHLSTIVLLAAITAGALLPGATSAFIIGGLGLTLLLKGRVLEVPSQVEAPVWDKALGWAWIVSVVAFFAAAAIGGPSVVSQVFLVLTAVCLFISRTGRKAIVSMLVGAYDTYGMSGLISDFLSYTRLAALGLAGMLVGQVANQLGTIVMQLLGPVAGLVFAVLVVVILHSINLVINLLGAFVHPTRLQFVEFFSKFYEGGGRNYAPLSPKTKSVVLHPQVGSQEGGKTT
ncbi:MAG: V-type ATP synthase subunit I [Coriobacteriia bacterium]|nr:V-type ATP synthase subunit I [Coriobacteriia bacterium]MBN2821894.1 V-type ATP synthase subunit I [Coriobacteriia bacterium]